MRSFAALLVATFALPYVSALGSTCTAPLGPGSAAASDPFWLQNIAHLGTSPLNPNPSSYSVFRNVKDYGAKGDGVTDDTVAINNAITAGTRCGFPTGCQSSTLSPALVYFPAGTYVVSASIIPYYYTSLVGDKKHLPTLKATAGFQGAAVIDADIYIPNGDGAEWYTNQNNFFRAVRNIVVDITAMAPTSGAVGIHWQVAQATSLVNVVVNMSTASGNNHQGIHMENGSGGVMTDLVFNGGQYGISVGNQQFTVRNITVNNAQTAIQAGWNWGWTFQGVTINNCGVGFSFSTGGTTINTQTVGSESIVDSVVTNTPIFIQTTSAQRTSLSGSILVENAKLTNVPRAVVDGAGTTILAGGTLTIPQWIQGNVYAGTGTGTTYKQATLTPPTKPLTLTTGNGVFGRSRPQYEAYAPSQFQSVKAAGAKGDGVTDDTTALQAVFDKYWGCKIIFFDAGIYIITDTLRIPAGAQVVGELWSSIQASGPNFASASSPRVAVQVGQSGQTLATEISDIVFTTKGGSAGAIVVEWNVGESSQGSAAMWDSHVRVGGFKGSNMEVSNCGNTTSHPVATCTGAYLSLHLTSSSSAYFENVWLWTADHDLDDPGQGELTIYSGRGFLIESSGPVWLLGTASEHHALYQYNFNNVRALYLALIQTETPYYQPIPAAPAPFTLSSSLSDPSYDSGASAWALYIQKSSNVHAYGVNLYSLFSNYDEACLTPVNCQSKIFNVDTTSTSIYVYNLATIGVTWQVSVGGVGIVNQNLNLDGFQSTVGLWASTGSDNLPPPPPSSTSSSSATTAKVSSTTSKASSTTSSSKTSSAASTSTSAVSVTGKCNGVSYTSSQVCDNGHVCPTGQYFCGTGCYNPATSCCSNGKISPASGSCTCNGQGFGSANYVCDNSSLCPSGTYSCGGACYSPTLYGCCNGGLTAPGNGC